MNQAWFVCSFFLKSMKQKLFVGDIYCLFKIKYKVKLAILYNNEIQYTLCNDMNMQRTTITDSDVNPKCIISRNKDRDFFLNEFVVVPNKDYNKGILNRIVGRINAIHLIDNHVFYKIDKGGSYCFLPSEIIACNEKELSKHNIDIKSIMFYQQVFELIKNTLGSYPRISLSVKRACILDTLKKTTDLIDRACVSFKENNVCPCGKHGRCEECPDDHWCGYGEDYL